MRNYTPRELSIRLALLLSIIVSLVANISWLFFSEFNLPFSILVFISSFLASYFLLAWGIKHFIENKFRVIYKTIHNLKLGLRRDPDKVNIDEDVFGKIRKEVIEWDKDNKQEIERLTDQEKFRREFLGNVSHELKTPIFSIQGLSLIHI